MPIFTDSLRNAGFFKARTDLLPQSELLQRIMLLECPNAILLYLSLALLKYVLNFFSFFYVISDISSFKWSCVSVKHQTSLFTKAISFNMSSECFLSDLVFINMIVNESLVTCGSNNGVNIPSLCNLWYSCFVFWFTLQHSGDTFQQNTCYQIWIFSSMLHPFELGWNSFVFVNQNL